jgi:glutamate/tyrosine decarboxylase-like PLP-dependent enzyme
MTDDLTLDPSDWDAFRASAHKVLDASLDRMKTAREGRVWTPLPDDQKQAFKAPVPHKGGDIEAQMLDLLPHGVGNTHPRFFGWVHGSGTPSNVIADIAAAAMNANLGGRDHGANYVEKQVVDWCREIFNFPDGSSGLIVSGTSIATLIALKTARDRVTNFTSRKSGCPPKLVGYTSTQTHSCVARTFDILGIGTDALRKIPVNDDFEIDCDALSSAIARDKAAGLTPFVIVGTAGAVNVGAIDDLDQLATIAQSENLWFHIDGAFGATGILSDYLRPKLNGLSRADSIAFDFHKWLHVNYDAGMVLMRSEALHRRAFSERPDYLKGAERGLAAANPWPTEYGPELSRGFRALKVWAQLATHGTEKLGALITQNCEQAQYLAQRISGSDDFEQLAPVPMQICCFRFAPSNATPNQLDQLNDEIIIRLQETGIAAPSSTLINGKNAIRVSITNHRTTTADLDLLFDAIRDIGTEILQEWAQQEA